VIRLNVHEAKTHLSRYLDRVEGGETFILCRHNRPIAEVRPIGVKTSRRRRKFGIDEGKFEIPPEFFEPLPEEIMRYFRGGAED
jgi:antitoxin (DNA-binding transcriptional repressor) of toxin-antitoxin stability system